MATEAILDRITSLSLRIEHISRTVRIVGVAPRMHMTDKLHQGLLSLNRNAKDRYFSGAG